MAAPTSDDAGLPRFGCKALLLLLYLALLAVSHLVRLPRAPEAPIAPGESEIHVAAVDGERLLERRVRIVYHDRIAPGGDPTSAVVLFHGSPGNKQDFAGLTPGLADGYRIVAPDLPGFGNSDSSIPDYSIRAHARYVLQLMGELGIERAHLVGFSMGGGVALELYDLAPETVRSITLLSAIGVQEYELLGDYHLNHLLHGMQLALFLGAFEAFPHMGWLDGAFFDVAYARNFYDTDQRPLRGILERFEPPMLILHGQHDFLVPPEAAREHSRIVPQSKLEMLDRGHFMVFNGGPSLAARIGEFLARVDAGLAPTRDRATAQRKAEARRPFDPSALPAASGFTLAILLLLIAAATLVSEDLTCIGVGLMASQGRIELWPGVLACFVGIYVGDVLLFLAGRYLGRPALKRAPLKWWISETQVDSASDWFSRRGPIVIGLSRFMPGARLPAYFAAGTLRTRFSAFCLYFFFAVALWTPLLVGGAMLAGIQASEYLELFRRRSAWALLLLGLWILIMVKLILPLFSFRGRRMIVRRWRRIWSWEFWPPWLFYPPVVLCVLWLGLRHRSPLLFTAANPAIEAGGFISESKAAILGGLDGSPSHVARSRLLRGADPAERRIRSATEFLGHHGLDYPCVLKPDAGQRGSGVVIAGDEDRLRTYLERSSVDTVVQEYVPGVEFGVFYYRYPDRPRGTIFSVTEKRIPHVTGDGRRTVEQLILSDRRAVCMAPLYLHRQVDQLDRVPAAGEAIPLVELGTHSRGAVFLDGGWVRSDALERVIDEISRGYRGFYFGRYDLRAPDADALKQGRNFKIIELNGVTSEATHIYDPRSSLLGAYRTLFEQWRIAFEIGRQNRERGVQPSTLRTLIRLVLDYRRTSRSHAD